MATQAILVEDSSPLIRFAPEGAWQDSQSTDSLASSYSGGSYHATSTQGATATFQFRGTGFAITGGRRPGYGSFSITVDGRTLFSGTPPPGPSPVKNTLGTVSGLPNDVHTVVLTNTGGSPIDIDSILFQVEMGPAGSTPDVTTIDDSDARLSYLPSPSAWALNPRPEFKDGTLHFSQADAAAVSLQFTGDAVAVYGNVAPDHADILVSMDGKSVTMPGGSRNGVVEVRPQVLLYWSDGLGGGQHTVTLSKAPNPNAGPFLDIDSFVVFSAGQNPAIPNNPSSGVPPGNVSPGPSVPSTSGPQPVNPQSANPKPVNRVGIIVGASAAGAAALLLISIGVFIWWTRRRRQQRSHLSNGSISPVTPILPMQGMMEAGRAPGVSAMRGGENSVFPFPPPASMARRPTYDRRLSRLSVAPSYYGDSEFSGGDADERRRKISSSSSDPLIPSVPRLAMPRMPPSAQTIPALVVTDTDVKRPRRPAQRPPTLNMS